MKQDITAQVDQHGHNATLVTVAQPDQEVRQNAVLQPHRLRHTVAMNSLRGIYIPILVSTALSEHVTPDPTVRILQPKLHVLLDIFVQQVLNLEHYIHIQLMDVYMVLI